MGPEATIELYSRIIKIFQTRFNAKFDQDFPPIVIYNLPIPDVVLDNSKEQIVCSMLLDACKKLESVGADFLVMPCNSIQKLVPYLRKYVKIPIYSIPEEVAYKTNKKGFKRIGLIATKTTIESKIYDNALSNIEIVTPKKKSMKKVTDIIMNILAGKKLKKDKKTLKTIISELRNKGAQSIILGCTELPLLIKKRDSEIEMLDTIQILADLSVEKCLK